MNVYDFDGTIYSGDSTLDFYIFELRRNKKIIRALPIQVKGFIQYLLGFQTKTKWKEKFFSFLLYIDDIDLEIENFWKEHEWKIEPWYKKQKEKTDIIISASPEFLLIPLQKRLGIEVILASMVDKSDFDFSIAIPEASFAIFSYSASIFFNNSSSNFIFAVRFS